MVLCVRVPKERGEEVRQELLSMSLVHEDYRIESDDNYLYVPVSPQSEDLDQYNLVERENNLSVDLPTVEDILGYSPAYRQLGDIIILKQKDANKEVAQAIMDSNLNPVTVIGEQSDVQGEDRTREYRVLAGNGTETIYTEYGYKYHLDPTKVYFATTLSTERKRVTSMVQSGQKVFDMFAGVGPYVTPSADSGADVVGVDINEDAVEYMRQNAEINNVEQNVTCLCDDVRSVDGFDRWADHIYMNLPKTAHEFAQTALSLCQDGALIHYYDFNSTEDGNTEGNAYDRFMSGLCSDEFSGNIHVEEHRHVREYAAGVVNTYTRFRYEM